MKAFLSMIIVSAALTSCAGKTDSTVAAAPKNSATDAVEYLCKFSNYSGENENLGSENDVKVSIKNGVATVIDNNRGNTVLARDDKQSNYPGKGYETWISKFLNDVDFTGIRFERKKNAPKVGYLMIGDSAYRRFAEFECKI